jgi:sugar phosphate isomerase/epimerase
MQTTGALNRNDAADRSAAYWKNFASNSLRVPGGGAPGASSMSRREFVEKAAAYSGVAGVLAASATTATASPLGLPIGSQTWPMRSMLKGFPAFAKMIAAIGVTRLELCSPIGYGEEFTVLKDPKEVSKILADHGLKAESSHFSMRELRHEQQRSIDWAKGVGITQMITATLADGNGGDHPTLDQVKKAADEYNKIAAVAAQAGMQQGLHNEGFEMSTVDGKRTYDLLLELLDPKLVKFQFQMSTITAGFVAADYFMKYPGRFSSMHLQDVDMKAPAQSSTGGATRRVGQYRQVPLGQGSIDWVKTFTAAKTGGVTSYFVEQSWELTQPSVAYLKTLTV